VLVHEKNPTGPPQKKKKKPGARLLDRSIGMGKYGLAAEPVLDSRAPVKINPMARAFVVGIPWKPHLFVSEGGSNHVLSVFEQSAVPRDSSLRVAKNGRTNYKN